jgi:hypothetical protein
MKRDDFADRYRSLAAIDRQVAELFVKRAAIHDELAGEQADPRTGRRKQRPHLPTQISGPISATDRARADKALQELAKRRKERGV